ncbi:ESX secretion-associated protein EspG [Parasphingorhabdus pacifica]
MSSATDTARRAVSLSALEFDVLTEHLGVAPVPLVLQVPSPGRTHTERVELVDSAWSTLSGRGLGTRACLDEDLERMLRLLVRPRCEVDGRLWLRRSVRVLAASGGADGAEGVLVVKDGDTLTLRPAAASGLPREAVSVLPPMGPGPGRSVTMRSADLDAAAEAAGDSVDDLGAALRNRGVRADDADELTRMVGDTDASGQFGAAARDERGRRLRASHVVGFFDRPHGRYVQVRRASASGDQWSTVAPADSRRLTGHVGELLGATTVQPG